MITKMSRIEELNEHTFSYQRLDDKMVFFLHSGDG